MDKTSINKPVVAKTTKDWINSLKIGDRVDFLIPEYSHRYQWELGTIISDLGDKFLIKRHCPILNDIRTIDKDDYDIYKALTPSPSPPPPNLFATDSTDEELDSCSEASSSPDYPHRWLKKLCQETSWHNFMIPTDDGYGYYEFGELCFENTNYPGHTCCTCSKRICPKCFMVTLPPSYRYQCKDCFILKESEYLYNLTRLIFDSLFSSRKRCIEMNIMSIIVHYGCVYRCRLCHKIFNFHPQFEKKLVYNIVSKETNLSVIREYNHAQMKNIKCGYDKCESDHREKERRNLFANDSDASSDDEWSTIS